MPNVSGASPGPTRRGRSIFQDAFYGMSMADWQLLRTPDGEEHVTPELVVFHLVEHEAGHAAQIGSLRRRSKKYIDRG